MWYCQIDSTKMQLRLPPRKLKKYKTFPKILINHQSFNKMAQQPKTKFYKFYKFYKKYKKKEHYF